MVEQFSMCLPMDVAKEWFLAHYNILDVDKEFILWYNPQDNTLNLEPKEWHNEVRNEASTGTGGTDRGDNPSEQRTTG